MSRLATTLPQPVTVTAQKDNTPLDTKYLQSKPTRQAVSKVNLGTAERISYRKQFAGSLLLSVQYRMHPSIAAFSSAVFYNGLLSSPLVLSSTRQFPRHLHSNYPSSNPGTSVRFVQVGGRNNESKEAVKSSEDLPATDPTNKSYRNVAEARQVVQMLTGLLGPEASFRGSIGIVTPYSAQVALIKSMMAKDEAFRKLAQSFPHEIEVKSVDAYQGRERDLIIFSAVRSNHHGRIGFLTDWRRMNVALTRAKSGLVVFGDAETLREGDRHWSAFVQWCDNMGCFVDD
jgi:superfamily I DNA and/or RNA helicase